GVISVEAISPTFNVAIEEEAKARDLLIDIVKTLAPPGWSVFVHDLPRIGQNERKSELKRALSEMFAVAPPSSLTDPPRGLTRQMEAGMIHVTLYPRRGASAIAGSSRFWWGDDTVNRIRRSVKTKREQARNSSLPTILAIGARVGYGIVHADQFIDALYGERTAVFNLNREMHHEFAPGGEFMQAGTDQPTFAGLLAFPLVGINRVHQPILFHHPRYKGILPDALLTLEQHSFDLGTRQARLQEAHRSDVLAGLNLVPDGFEDLDC
ncbi:MAG: hypothetical protein ACYDAR_14475, partial [Thermomicrobiales bacterium]